MLDHLQQVVSRLERDRRADRLAQLGLDDAAKPVHAAVLLDELVGLGNRLELGLAEGGRGDDFAVVAKIELQSLGDFFAAVLRLVRRRPVLRHDVVDRAANQAQVLRDGLAVETPQPLHFRVDPVEDQFLGILYGRFVGGVHLGHANPDPPPEYAETLFQAVLQLAEDLQSQVLRVEGHEHAVDLAEILRGDLVVLRRLGQHARHVNQLHVAGRPVQRHADADLGQQLVGRRRPQRGGVEVLVLNHLVEEGLQARPVRHAAPDDLPLLLGLDELPAGGLGALHEPQEELGHCQQLVVVAILDRRLQLGDQLVVRDRQRIGDRVVFGQLPHVKAQERGKRVPPPGEFLVGDVPQLIFRAAVQGNELDPHDSVGAGTSLASLRQEVVSHELVEHGQLAGPRDPQEADQVAGLGNVPGDPVLERQDPLASLGLGIVQAAELVAAGNPRQSLFRVRDPQKAGLGLVEQRTSRGSTNLQFATSKGMAFPSVQVMPVGGVGRPAPNAHGVSTCSS